MLSNPAPGLRHGKEPAGAAVPSAVHHKPAASLCAAPSGPLYLCGTGWQPEGFPVPRPGASSCVVSV